MNLERMIALANALDIYDVDIGFSLTKDPRHADCRWRCTLNGIGDCGPTPEVAAERIESHLEGKVEGKRLAALRLAENLNKALLLDHPSTTGETQ